ncbi:MAG: DivIVA domain-containing protein [Actinomycetota bacterium]|nr:DivIVA domain-containing protein [Actinomycetota bacterium]
MDITPKQIQERRFHDAFRGYSHEEVDAFLDEVAMAFERVYSQNQQFHHKFLEVEQELTQAKGSEDMLKRMLVTAQETADKAVQEAREKAQGLVSSSESKANEIESRSKETASRTIAEAEAKAEQIVSGAIAKERELQVSIEGLRSFESEYRARIRAFIESQLKQLPVDFEPVQAPRPLATPADDKTVIRAPESFPQPAAQPPGATAHESVRPDDLAVLDVAAGGPDNPGSNGDTKEPDDSDQADLSQKVQMPAHVGSVTPPESVVRLEQDGPAQERSIKELFWGDE